MRLRTLLLSATLVLSMSASVTAAENTVINVNGTVIEAENEPLNINGTVYVPIREISDALNIDIKWDENIKTVYIDTELEHKSAAENTGSESSSNTPPPAVIWFG